MEMERSMTCSWPTSVPGTTRRALLACGEREQRPAMLQRKSARIQEARVPWGFGNVFSIVCTGNGEWEKTRIWTEVSKTTTMLDGGENRWRERKPIATKANGSNIVLEFNIDDKLLFSIIPN